MAGPGLRVGMIGCGDVGERSATGLRDADHTELAGVVDIDKVVARTLGEAYNVPWSRDPAELLARSDVDAVYVAVPNHLLSSIVIQAAQAGKHVLCEKPMATSLADADRMLAACSEAHVSLGVAFEAQVTPELQRLHRIIAAGGIGNIIGTRIIAMLDKPDTYWAYGYDHRTATNWRSSKSKAGGGMLITTHIHDINTVRYLTGLEARRIYAEYGTFVTQVEVEDLAFATIRYDNGAVGLIEGSSCIKGNGMDRDVANYIYGSEGQVRLADTLSIYTTREVDGLSPGIWHEIGKPPDSLAVGRVRVMDGFGSAVLEGRPLPVSGRDGRAALAVALTAYQAGAQGIPVDVDMGQTY
jgi:UDP-N-acetyl-2-amino-2-deoxyglucuronate dehydrogenase